jgi:dTDP-4-dehydrorhamnose 3,5-epimerase
MAELTPLEISGAWLYQTDVNQDDRGYLAEWFRADLFQKALGTKFEFAQANLSHSSKGVVRGIHFSVAPQGQAKWMTCLGGSLWDVVVDIRPKSLTFKKWIAVELKSGSGKSLYVSENLGHAFLSLTDETTMAYLLSSPYSPKDELAINPTDPEIGIEWPISELQFSDKDRAAPNIREVLEKLRSDPRYAQY